MKISFSLRATVVLIAFLIAVYIYLFCGPFFFQDREISYNSIKHLRSEAVHALTPKEAALSYMYDGIDPSEIPQENKLDIKVSTTSNKSIVTIIDRNCQSDSVYVTCDRFTLHREGSIWIPDRHQAAWQGRGRFGWTTSPAL